MTPIQNEITPLFRRYLELDEAADFAGWEKIRVFAADSLEEAWLLARPGDASKFEDPKFARMVRGSNGKWLEKQAPGDSYKVILASWGRSLRELTVCLAHELRHCLDYQKAVEGMPFESCWAGFEYYHNWTEYRAMKAAVRCRYFLDKDSAGDLDDFDHLASLLGELSADSLEGILRAEREKSFLDIPYFLARYLGASRAVRELSRERGLNAPSLEEEALTPAYLTERYGPVLELADEWDELETCRLDTGGGERCQRIGSRLREQIFGK